MKRILLSFALMLTAMTAAAQDDGMFYYAYDDATQTATVSYRTKDGNKVGGSYYGDVVIPAKAPNGYDVTVIGENAFYNSNTMTSLTIPATIDSIGRDPFNGCKAHLTKIVIEDTDRLLRTYAMHYWAGREMVFGGQGIDLDVKEAYIGRPFRTAIDESESRRQSIFLGNDSLRTVTFSDRYEEVPDGMFEDCDSLRSVHLSPNTKRIGKEAFYYCQSLSAITLPDGVEVIDECAFQRCKTLEKINLPKSLRIIGGYAFNRCEQFTCFTIPGSVDSIGVSILDDCTNLKRIDIAYSSKPLKYCCTSQFYNSLRSASIDTLYTDRYIDGAFSDNRTLKKLYVGPNVTALCDGLFSDCYNIEEIYSQNTVPPTCEGGRVFAYLNKENCRLHVPVGSLDAYKEAFVWKDFFNIDEVAGISNIKTDASTVIGSYTLGGQRTTAGQRGLIIHRMNDGTTRKVISK